MLVPWIKNGSGKDDEERLGLGNTLEVDSGLSVKLGVAELNSLHCVKQSLVVRQMAQCGGNSTCFKPWTFHSWVVYSSFQLPHGMKADTVLN